MGRYIEREGKAANIGCLSKSNLDVLGSVSAPFFVDVWTGCEEGRSVLLSIS